jgi:hypothetical protein
VPLASNRYEVGITFLGEAGYLCNWTSTAHGGIDLYTNRWPELRYQLAERCLDAARVDQL